MPSPVSIYVVHHLKSTVATQLASDLFDWFRLSLMTENQSGAGLPVYFRRRIVDARLQPDISFKDSDLNIVVLLVDQEMVGDIDWRTALVRFAKKARVWNKEHFGKNRVQILPIAMHEGLYRIAEVYESFNPIRLLDMALDQMTAFLRRAVTEAAARFVRADASHTTPPLNVFLSHAKRDGRPIAEYIRDSVRSFGQMVAWYDANDLPYGGEWKAKMINSAGTDTVAMVAIVTDTYPSRQWCRLEATEARTPKRLNNRAINSPGIWRVQPVVGIYNLGNQWTRPMPMLEGVPRIGWDPMEPRKITERLVDRLALEVMLGLVHRKVAVSIARRQTKPNEYCYLTWVPDTWTLSKLRQIMLKGKEDVAKIRYIVYPGYGLAKTEILELDSVVRSFRKDTKLVSFEEAMS
jgi:hypothetical protein